MEIGGGGGGGVGGGGGGGGFGGELAGVGGCGWLRIPVIHPAVVVMFI